jgi:hypothetical protein
MCSAILLNWRNSDGVSLGNGFSSITGVDAVSLAGWLPSEEMDAMLTWGVDC